MSLQSIGSGRIESSFSDMSKSNGGGGGGGFGSDFRFGFLYLNTQFGCLDRGEHIRLFLLPLPAIFMVLLHSFMLLNLSLQYGYYN